MLRAAPFVVTAQRQAQGDSGSNLLNLTEEQQFHFGMLVPAQDPLQFNLIWRHEGIGRTFCRPKPITTICPWGAGSSTEVEELFNVIIDDCLEAILEVHYTIHYTIKSELGGFERDSIMLSD
jgi:hypothetical protein